jgi:phosphoribosylformylglycinamidine cyclo-ligase
VDKDKVVDGRSIVPGDLVLGLSSSGLHSNGYSLVRRVLLEERGLSLAEHGPGLGCALGEELLRPTKIYVRPLQRLMAKVAVKGMAHITGGGLLENIPRVLPPGVRVVLRAGSWPVLPVFHLLRELGSIAEEEMLRTFNLGIGFVVIVAAEDVESAVAILQEVGEKVYVIGRVVTGEPGVEVEGRLFP